MAATDNLIDFDVIERQKENIQSLPSGRSARKLAELYAAPLHKLATPIPHEAKEAHELARAGFEDELAVIEEADDPLDVYDRYVRWTLDTFPAAQATPQSQLHTLLERATRAFVATPQYRNDPRYLRLWLLYVRLFADAPREAFRFLARHAIGDSLALFYEAYAAWLEAAGCWAQADQVFHAGIARDARPSARLHRKFAEFCARRAVAETTIDPHDGATPPSPALPTVRPALAAKLDPFAPLPAVNAQRAAHAGLLASAHGRTGRPKLAVFSDAEAIPSTNPDALGSRGPESAGWEWLGSRAERKKENTMAAATWTGEVLAAGTGTRSEVAAKMLVFRDPSRQQLALPSLIVVPAESQVMVHAQTGKQERIFVDLQVVYPTPDVPGSELSFEEVWAANRGWTNCRWDRDDGNGDTSLGRGAGSDACDMIFQPDGGALLDENGVVQEPVAIERRGRRTRLLEVNETQLIKAKLDSPSGRKIKKKAVTEPTMTIHTKAATDEIYEIFGQPLQPHEGAGADEAESEASAGAEAETEDDGIGYETDGDYTSGVESTGTTRQLSTSEAGDEDEAEVVEEDDEEADEEDEDDNDSDDDDELCSGAKSDSEWSDFTASKHVLKVLAKHGHSEVDESDGAEAASTLEEPEEGDEGEAHEGEEAQVERGEGKRGKDDDAKDDDDQDDEHRSQTRTVFGALLPSPPGNCDLPTRPYRDATEMANSRLPFMTPITERTESSLSAGTDRHGSVQTPSRRDDSGNSSSPVLYLDRSSPEQVEEPGSMPVSVPLLVPRPRTPLVLLQKRIAPATASTSTSKIGNAKSEGGIRAAAGRREPVIKDLLCNPVDSAVRAEILASLRPPLSSYRGFFDRQDLSFDQGAEIRRCLHKCQAAERPVMLEFPDARERYTLRRELGTGAFAPVYLVEHEQLDDNVDRQDDDAAHQLSGKRGGLEALKIETPASAWEFYMMRLVHARLGPHERASTSVSVAHELHLYGDSGLLVQPYHRHGTLLDVINMFRAEPSGAMDEMLAIFFAVELLRTVEALHGHGLMHGDLKPDNCMLRLDGGSGGEPTGPYRADGSEGWERRGVVLIDLGRSVDMRSFGAGVQFVADWRPAAQDCPEMRNGRPWTWQMDYYGLAGVLHCLLFGRYMAEPVADTSLPRRYRLRDSLKRYWQTDLWADCFDALLNPAAAAATTAAAEDSGKMPLLRTLRRLRIRMEAFLEQHADRGVGLRALLARVEAHAAGRR